MQMAKKINYGEVYTHYAHYNPKKDGRVIDTEIWVRGSVYGLRKCLSTEHFMLYMQKNKRVYLKGKPSRMFIYLRLKNAAY